LSTVCAQIPASVNHIPAHAGISTTGGWNLVK